MKNAQARELAAIQAQAQAEMAAAAAAAETRRQQQEEELRKAAELRAVTKAFELTALVTLEQLPALSAPTPSQLQHQGQLHQLLSSWSAAGSATPFTFQDLITHTSMAANAPFFVRTALGSRWSEWFPSADPGPAQVVPRQVAQLLLKSLGKLKTQWQKHETNEAIAESGKASFAAMTGAAKKRKALLLDEEMIPSQ